jgi:hypothetical protein
LERFMDSLDPTPTVEVTHRTLKNEQGRVFREIDAAGVVAVRNRDQIDGILMAPSMFDALRSRAADAERLLAALPLLIAAARAEVAIPSETFQALGIGGRDDWRALNELLAGVPVTITHGEDGHPLPDTSKVVLQHNRVEEDDEELVVNADAATAVT